MFGYCDKLNIVTLLPFPSMTISDFRVCSKIYSMLRRPPSTYYTWTLHAWLTKMHQNCIARRETHNRMEEKSSTFPGLEWPELRGKKTKEWKVRDKKVIFSAAGSESLGWTDTMSNPDWLSRDSKSAHFDSANLGTIHLHQHSLLKTNIMKESNHREIII